MTISSTLTWESEIAAGASKDAAALRRLVKALTSADAALKASSTAPLAQSLGAVGNAAAIASVQMAQLEAATTREAAASKNAAQQNAAMAKVVLAQAKGAQARQRLAVQSAAAIATAEAQGEQKRLAIAAKGAADLERGEARHAQKMAEIAAKGAQQKARAERAAGPAGVDGEAAFGSLMGSGGKITSAIELASTISPKLASLGAAAGPIGAAATLAITAATKVYEEVDAAYQKAVSVITSLGHTGIGLVIAATSSRESLVGAFEAMGKSSGASEALYEKVVALSIKTGRDKEKIAGEFKRLGAIGFKDAQLPAIATMLADVSAVKGEGKANQLEKLLTKIQAKNALDPRVVTALTNQGFSQKELYATLAKAIHKSESDIPGLIKAGKINAATAEEAIAKVVKKQLGPQAEKQANTVLMLLARLKTAAEELFDVGENAISPLKKFLGNMIAMLSSGYGEKLKSAIGNLFGAIFGTAFGKLNSAGGQAQMVALFVRVTGAVNKTAEAVRRLRPLVDRLIDSFMRMSNSKNLDKLVKVAEMTAKAKMTGLNDDMQQTQWKVKAAASPGEAAKDFVSNPFKEIAKGTGHGGAYEEGEQSLRKMLGIQDPDEQDAKGAAKKKKKGPKSANDNNADAINGFAIPQVSEDKSAEMSDQGADIGSALNMGMVLGIQSNQDAAIAAAGLTADMIIARVRATLKTHSPSEEFANIAGDSVAGMTLGFNAHGPKAADAAGKMAKNALAKGKAGASAGAAVASAHGGGNSYSVTVQVFGSKSSPQEIADVVISELRRMAEAA